jgi:hypothetical protein
MMDGDPVRVTAERVLALRKAAVDDYRADLRVKLVALGSVTFQGETVWLPLDAVLDLINGDDQ